MNQRLAGALRLAVVVAGIGSTVAGVGCASHRKPQGPLVSDAKGSVVYGSFNTLSEAKLTPRSPVTNLFAIGDALYLYTQDNTVYALSQGLDIRFLRSIVRTGEELRPPVQVGDEVIFPTSLGLFVHTKTGEPLRTVTLKNPLSSDVHVDQRGVLLAGTAAATGGFVAVIDPKRTVRAADQETLIGNVRSAPVSMQGIVFAATDRGRVFAIGTENRAAWPIAGMAFETGRPIEADLVIDEYALYVASTDLKLYALDRTNGKIKWRYAAEEPLREAPFVTKDRVYQIVPERGLVAINKLEGKLYREPVWTAPDVTQVVTADDRYVYGVQGNTRLVALGIADGQVKFSATGQFDFVAAGTDAIFAASRDGRVAKLKRGTYAGDSVAAGR